MLLVDIKQENVISIFVDTLLRRLCVVLVSWYTVWKRREVDYISNSTTTDIYTFSILLMLSRSSLDKKACLYL